MNGFKKSEWLIANRSPSYFIKIEPIQIVLGDADDAEYADARRLFIFFKTIYYLCLSALVCVICVP